MKRVFVSVPFAGRTESEIRIDMEETILEYLKSNKDECIFVDNYDIDKYDRIVASGCKYPNVYYLSLALNQISRCDDVIFSKNWEKARGCRVERLVYDLYFNKS